MAIVGASTNVVGGGGGETGLANMLGPLRHQSLSHVLASDVFLSVSMVRRVVVNVGLLEKESSSGEIDVPDLDWSLYLPHPPAKMLQLDLICHVLYLPR